MKRAVILTLSNSNLLCDELYDTYKDSIPREFMKYAYKGNSSLRIPLLAESAELAEAIQHAQSRGEQPRLFLESHYTPGELKKHPYFEMLLPWPLELDGTFVEDYGTKFHGGCPFCGLDKKYAGDVYIDRKFVRKYRMGTLLNILFANEEVKNIVQENQLSGIDFMQMLKDYKGRELNGYHVAEINSVLPPLSSLTWVINHGVHNEKCGHAVRYLQSPLRYEEEKLSEAKDFNLSFEYLNNFQEQSIIVSAKVKQIFTKHKIFARFRPVDID